MTSKIEREVESERVDRGQDYRCICNGQSKNASMNSVSLSLLPAVPVYKVASWWCCGKCVIVRHLVFLSEMCVSACVMWLYQLILCLLITPQSLFKSISDTHFPLCLTCQLCVSYTCPHPGTKEWHTEPTNLKLLSCVCAMTVQRHHTRWGCVFCLACVFLICSVLSSQVCLEIYEIFIYTVFLTHQHDCLK